MPTSKLLKSFLLAGAGVAAATALLAGGLIAWLTITDPFGGPAHPSDAAMLTQFAKMRSALEELVVMIEQDEGIQRLAPDFTRPDPAPIASTRLADYRVRLQAAGIARGFSHHRDTIELIVSTRGLAVSGSGKSFVHAANADADAIVVDGDLDAAAAALTDKDVLLQRRIAANWWLQLDMR